MWQPIDTAPKDGTNFQAWATNGNDGWWEPFCCFFDDAYQVWRDDIEPEGDGMWISVGLEKRMWFTHWQPQPESPELPENIGTHENHVGTHKK